MANQLRATGKAWVSSTRLEHCGSQRYKVGWIADASTFNDKLPRILTASAGSSAQSSPAPRWTHFISIPLVDAQEQYRELQARIISCEAPFVDESVFLPPTKLHFSLIMLALQSKDHVESARKVLKSCRRSLQELYRRNGENPAMIHFSGLDTFQKRLDKVQVVFLRPDNSSPGVELIEKISFVLVNAFRSAKLISAEHAEGLLEADTHKSFITLHATVLNSKYRKTKSELRSQGNGKSRQNRIAMDVRPIFDSLRNVAFGPLPFDAVHLSALGGVGHDGYYQCDEAIKLNEHKSDD